MAHEKEVQELMEACRRDFLKPGESIFSVELERVPSPTHSITCLCSMCDKDFKAYGVVCLLIECGQYVGEICPDCIALGPRRTAELMREQAKEAESPEEAFRLEFKAHNLEEIKDWPAAK